MTRKLNAALFLDIYQLLNQASVNASGAEVAATMIFLSIAGRGFGSAEWEIRARSKVFNFARGTILATMNVCFVYEILLWNSASLKPMPCHASLKWRVNASVFNIILVV